MSKLPDGPSSTLLTTLKIGTSPFDFYRDCFDRYGDPMTMPALNGTVVCTGTPEGARQIFTAGADYFLPFGSEAAEPVAKNSIFLLSGPAHKRERKLLAPPFHGARMKVYADAMQAATFGVIDQWETGRVLPSIEVFQQISLEVILRAVFGVDDIEEIHRLHEEVREFVEAISPSFLFFKILQREFGGVGPWAKFKRAEGRFNAMVYDIIAQRLETGHRGEDILSLMMDARYDDGSSMHEDHIRDELVTLLIAGHETTAIIMTWIVDHIHRDPAVMAKLMTELDLAGPDAPPEHYTTLPYLTAICKETLRMHPVLSDHIRTLAKPMTLLGYELPAGVSVAVLPSIIHQNPELYPNPGQFIPERFIDAKHSPYEFLPFGGQPRRCIGSAFAMFEMRIAIATLMTQCRFELAECEPPEPIRQNLIMGLDRDVTLRLIERRTTVR